MNTHKTILLLSAISLMTACGGGGGGSAGPAPATNRAPVANAGTDVATDERSGVTLNGSGTDADGDALTYAWSQVSGPAVTFTDSTDPGTSIDVPEIPVGPEQTATLRLTVRDTAGASSTDEVDVVVRSSDFQVYVFQGTVVRRDAATGTVQALSTRTDAADFFMSPDNENVAFVATDGSLHIVNTGTAQETAITDSLRAGTVTGDVAWSPDSATLAFTADGDLAGIEEVYLVAADGSDLRKINGSVGNPASVELTEVRWSPDSRYVAQKVISLSNGFEVGVNSHDTQNPNSIRLTPTLLPGAPDFYYEFSPDSTMLAFVADIDNAGVRDRGLWVTPANSRAPVRIDTGIPRTSQIREVAWSPAGDRIGFRHLAANNNGGVDLYVATPDGSSVVEAAMPRTDAVFTWAWSPDGSALAYTARAIGTAQGNVLRVFSMATLTWESVTPAMPDQQGVREFAWSPDGSWLAYTADQETDEKFELFVLRPDGSENLRVSGTLAADADVNPVNWLNCGTPFFTDFEEFGSFVWAPDSSRIAYRVGSLATGFPMYTVRPDGSENIEASVPLPTVPSPNDGVLVEAMKWSRDSSALSYAEVAYECDFFFLEATRLREWQSTPDGLNQTIVRSPSSLPAAVWSD